MVNESEERNPRGRLKVFLGYGGGIGKSFQMLDEGRRRRERGEDVVVCALQPQYPPEIQAILQKLEVIPTLKIRDAESIDVPAVIRRHPRLRSLTVSPMRTRRAVPMPIAGRTWNNCSKLESRSSPQ